MLPLATYRLQLRNGVDFDRVQADLDAISRLGISHLYLSPIFWAADGSTHGYDVVRPDAIDPALGGIDGFRRMAAAARDRGMGVILDIVPNHTAFSLENPWLRDVLRHGQESRYAQHFDIDWSAGKLVLPWLPRPVKAMQAEGALRVEPDERLGAVLVANDLRLPLRGGAIGTLDEVLERQCWQLADWQAGSDSITHRRFFNITELICMQVDREDVFEDMHDLIFALIASGDVQGLRVDHVDGLRAPGAYLARLRDRVGPDVPLWVEKILVGDEPLPDWPVEGTTGYEHGCTIARVLTRPAGVAALTALWSGSVERETDYGVTLTAAKRDILRYDLAAEVLRLVDIAREALKDDPEHDPGPETLRQAVIGLLEGMPVYRTYFGEDGQSTAFADQVLEKVRAHVRAHLRPPTTALRLIELIGAAQTPIERAFRDLFQQTSGAVLAKSAEDTAIYRHLPYPAACEVGASPDEVTLTTEAFASAWAAMPPGAMVLTSTHDTKRSEDARMRLVACAHLPDAVQILWREVCALPRVQAAEAEGMRKDELWALMHALLAAWQPAESAPDLADRVEAYLQKAMREAKEITAPSYPDEGAEAPVLHLARDLAEAWQADLPEAAAALVGRGEMLALVQVTLKTLARGVPDFYRGCEGPAFWLTDPDNRAAVDVAGLRALENAQSFGGRKYRLTQSLLALRQERITDLRGPGETWVEQAGRGFVVRRVTTGGVICVALRAGREPVLQVDRASQPGLGDAA